MVYINILFREYTVFYKYFNISIPYADEDMEKSKYL